MDTNIDDDDDSDYPEEFTLSRDDKNAIEVASDVARLLLTHPQIKPQQVVGIGRALYVLGKLPKITWGAAVEFGVSYRCGGEFTAIKFSISDEWFEITAGGSSYDPGIGHDSYDEPGWSFDIHGKGERRCELDSLDSRVRSLLNLGGSVDVFDESSFKMKDDEEDDAKS